MHIRLVIISILVVLIIIFYFFKYLIKVNQENKDKSKEIIKLESETENNYIKYKDMEDKHLNLAKEYDRKIKEVRELRKSYDEYQKDVTIMLLKERIEYKEDKNVR